MRGKILSAVVCAGALGTGAALFWGVGGGAAPSGYGFYVDRIHPAGLARDDLRRTLIAPLFRELPPSYDSPLDYRAGAAARDKLLVPYVRAIGPFEFGDDPENELVRTVLGDLRFVWDDVRAVAEGPVHNPPIRVLVKHYPRPELRGKCVAVHVTFYTTADPVLDRYRQNAGSIVEFHRTYQLAERKTRLVAAAVEVGRAFRMVPRRRSLGGMLGSDAGRVGRDPMSTQHFERIDGGRRTGLAWFDRSEGLGPEDSWGCAFQVDGRRTRTEPLADRLRDALLEIVAKT